MDDGRSALKALELDGKEVEINWIIAAIFHFVILFDKFIQGNVESERAQSWGYSLSISVAWFRFSDSPDLLSVVYGLSLSLFLFLVPRIHSAGCPVWLPTHVSNSKHQILGYIFVKVRSPSVFYIKCSLEQILCPTNVYFCLYKSGIYNRNVFVNSFSCVVLDIWQDGPSSAEIWISSFQNWPHCSKSCLNERFSSGRWFWLAW